MCADSEKKNTHFKAVVTNIASVVNQETHDENASLTEVDRQLFSAWNATKQDYPMDACVPQLIALQAMMKPDMVALVAGDRALNYGDLNRRANQLGSYLRSQGVGPGVIVGCCVERSLDMVVGLLGILKAGGAYLPLDPSYPPERLAFMLDDACVPLLLTQQHLSSHLSLSDHVQAIYLNTDDLSRRDAKELTPLAELTDLAYVIYTSGSTGMPKGVEITHENLLNLVFWHQQAFNVTTYDRATQLTSPAFDATGWELWPYLAAGARVFLLDDETRVDPELLRDWLLREEITITFLPTPLAECVLSLDWPAQTALRFLLTGADVLHHYPAASLPFSLVNNYGPTEATVVATSGLVPPKERIDILPPIGRPIANAQIYLLDDYLRQVAPGEHGEIYIGGKGVARGYLNRPELTAERFIHHPFCDQPGARLYKTGDLARFLPDGQIAFIGRTDHQIKIRGFRIEPGEIVFALNRYPGIKDSFVTARDDAGDPGDRRLVAYIVTDPGIEIFASPLRESLMQYIPDYMLPSTFVQLNRLPVTSNGKIDLISLPVPSATNTLQDEIRIVPGTPVEKRVTEIVCTLLEIEGLSIDDNFFMLGGHSLLGTQIIAHIAESFSVDLSLRTLFEAPTVRELSAEIEQLLLATVNVMSETKIVRFLSK